MNAQIFEKNIDLYYVIPIVILVFATTSLTIGYANIEPTKRAQRQPDYIV